MCFCKREWERRISRRKYLCHGDISENGDVFVSKQDLEDGSVLVKPESSDTFVVGKTKNLQGVYNINKGYAVFRKVSVLRKRRILYRAGKRTSYGLSNYDHIVQEGSSVNSNDVVFQSNLKNKTFNYSERGEIKMLKENLKTVEERIQSACKKAGRKREEITLIAVSKTKPPHMLQEAYDLGVRIFGENKVQEIREKYEVLPKDIDWHMIGHLQTNKVKYIVDKVKLIHSVDSFKLGEVIEKEAAKQNRIIDILLEVNVAQESSKFGLKTEEVIPLMENFPKITTYTL